MTARTTIFCSSCGTSNPLGARFCHACGVVIGTVSPPPSQTAAPALTAPAASPAGPVREAIAMTSRQHYSYWMGVRPVAIFTFLLTVLGTVGVPGLVWAGRPARWIPSDTSVLGEWSATMTARPALVYVVASLLVLLLATGLLREVRPRYRDVGGAAYRSFRRTLRQRDGIRSLMAPGGVRIAVVLLVALWVCLAGIAIWNQGDLAGQGYDLSFGIVLAIALPVIGAVGTALLWPVGSESVYMDRQGVITRG